MAYLELFGGLTYLLLGGDLLVRGAVGLARRARISPLVVGLTVVALGTSAPELVVAVQAALAGHPAIALGNVVGSNIANILLVLGVPALIRPIPGDQPSGGRDALTMLIVSIGFFVMCAFGPLGRPQGFLLLAVLLVFLGMSAREGRSVEARARAEEVELERAFGLPSRPRTILAFLVLGLIFLPLGADLMVSGAVEVAYGFGIPELAIGLTVVAVGTSLPELATTVMAAVGRHEDVAMGNVLGSNILNVLAIMGAAAVATSTPIAIDPELLGLDLPVMIGTAAAISLLAWRRIGIGRGLGVLFLSLYAAYVVTLLVRS
jgi:cation:H+ antiporter